MAAAAGLAVAIVLLVLWLFPGDEKRILRLLDEVAETATLKGDEHPLVKVGGGNKLGGYFTADVVVHLDAPGVGERNVEGREDLIQTVNAVRATVQQALIRFENIRLEIDSSRQAATARLVAIAQVDQSPDPFVQELVVGLVRTDDGWRIRRVEPIQARVIPSVVQ